MTNHNSIVKTARTRRLGPWRWTVSVCSYGPPQYTNTGARAEAPSAFGFTRRSATRRAVRKLWRSSCSSDVDQRKYGRPYGVMTSGVDL